MIGGSDAVVENLRAGGIITVRFGAHADQVTIGIDNTTDVYYTVDGSNPSIGAGTKVANGSNEATVICPAGPTVVKLLAAVACVASLATGGRGLSRPSRPHTRPVADQ